MLRSLLPALALLALAPLAAAAGKSPGAYANIPAANAGACARACSNDGLCMAWSFQTSGACELTAIVPLNPPDGVAAFGVSSRAPAMMTELRGQTPTTLAAITPVPAATPVALTPLTDQPALTAPAEDELSLQLLGGPEDGDIRPRLVSRQ